MRNLELDLENLPNEISTPEIHVRLALDTPPCKSRFVDIRRPGIVPNRQRGRSRRLDAYGRLSQCTYDPYLTVLGTFMEEMGCF